MPSPTDANPYPSAGVCTRTPSIFAQAACENTPENSLYQQSVPGTGLLSIAFRPGRCGVVKEAVDVPVWIAQPVDRSGIPMEELGIQQLAGSAIPVHASLS